MEATENGLTTRYLVDTNRPFAQVIEERDDLGNLEAHYTWGPELLRQDRQGVVSYYHADGHASIRALTDPAGQVTDTYDYDAYGGLLARTGSSVNDYRYAGEQFVPGLGGYYLRARYYQPGVGRFLMRDEFGGFDREPLTLNKYLYASANPVMGVDPSGRFAVSLTGVSVVNAVLGNLAGLTFAPPISVQFVGASHREGPIAIAEDVIPPGEAAVYEEFPLPKDNLLTIEIEAAPGEREIPVEIGLSGIPKNAPEESFRKTVFDLEANTTRRFDLRVGSEKIRKVSIRVLNRSGLPGRPPGTAIRVRIGPTSIFGPPPKPPGVPL